MEYILEKRPEAAQEFIQPAIANITHIHPDLLSVLPIECNEKTKEAISRLQQLHQQDPNNIDIIFKIFILSKKICKQSDCQIKCNTQTCQHLKENWQSISGNLMGLFDMGSKVNQKEKELQENYYTFVHGQRWEYQFAETLFTKLYELKTGNQCPEFLFAHVKELPQNIKSEERIHDKLLKNGRTSKKSRQRLLFLNYAFFGNSTNSGSSTAGYIADNTNVGGIEIDIKELFEWHGLEHIYNKYQKELEELQAEHSSLSKMGNLLLIAVPKDIVDECVYPAVSGGYKKKIKTLDGQKLTKTSDVLEAIKAGKVKNTDKIELCLIMTKSKNGGMSPESGIKFYDFNTVEENKWAAYQDKRDDLMGRMEVDIKAEQEGSCSSTEDWQMDETDIESPFFI